MTASEAIAKAILEYLVPGASARYLQDQSAGTHDFDLEYPDWRIVPVEVTTSVDEKWMRTNAAIRDQRKGGPFVGRAICEHDWYVFPALRGGRSINRIRQHVDKYLAAIEAERLGQFVAPADAWRFSSVQRIWADLDIEAGYTLILDPPGRIAIAPPADQVARADGRGVEEAVLKEANKTDNLAKLRAVGGAERHLFVYIDPANFPAYLAITEGDLPPGVPPLPAEITHVWAATMISSHSEYAVWTATSVRSWESAGIVTIESKSLAAQNVGGDREDSSSA